MTRPKGKRGSWYTTFFGKELPVVHSNYLDMANKRYYDPNLKPGAPRWDRMVRLIEDVRQLGMAVVQIDKSATDFSRVGYLGVIFASNVRLDGTTFSFDIR